MAIVVRIPSALRSLSRGHAEVALIGETVASVLDALFIEYPALKPYLTDADGRLRSFIKIVLNETDIRILSNLETCLKDGDNIFIIPAIAGGN
jgi:molybdopterin converting factor small subunit